jgi:nucleoside-diphosphate-sugar epimerase
MGQASSLAVARESWRNFLAYGLSAMKLRGRSDSFFLSMRDSIGAFHHALDTGVAPLLDGAFGRNMVEICDRIAAQILPQKVASTKDAPNTTAKVNDVAVLGGTGFIGAALVSRLCNAGLNVSVMARNLANLGAPFHSAGVTLHRGDIRVAADVASAIAGAKVVINLAHGGGGNSWDEIYDAMVGGAETIAKECLKAGTTRLIYVGSIAALYLGPQVTAVVGATKPDPQAMRRGDYARAKALCEKRLQQLLEKEPIEVCILRPGLVVGRGTSPFHSGLGFFNNDQHCIGWNDGRNPLPFVLVDDVAEAISLACASPMAAGKSFNLVGEFRPSARHYISELAKRLHRPLRFHGKSARGLYRDELLKWCVKRIGGRHVSMPSLRDIRSRGLEAVFDCSDVKASLAWQPVSDAALFYAKAFEAFDAR